jgi:histidinol phosphatase-like enzyme
MIGDSAIDIEAADRLGINSVLLNSNNKNDSFIKYKPTFIEKNLYDSIKKILD